MDNYWDKVAESYDEHLKKSEGAYAQAIELARKELWVEDVVLDIGTGTGEIPFAIANRVASVVAIDSSRKMIELAKTKAQQKKTQNIEFVVKDCNLIDYPAKSFDVIIIANLLHLIPNPDRFLRNVSSLLKTDGKLIAPTYLHAHDPRTLELSKSMEAMGHPIENRFSMDSFVAMVEGSGYVVKTSEILPNIMPMLYLSAKVRQEGVEKVNINPTYMLARR